MIATLRLSINSSDGIMFYRLWNVKTECNLFLSCFFVVVVFLGIFGVFNLFIMFVNSLDSGPLMKSTLTTELSIQKLSNGINLGNCYFPDSQVKAAAINKNQQL